MRRVSKIPMITDAQAKALEDRWIDAPAKDIPAADAQAYLAWAMMKLAPREQRN